MTTNKLTKTMDRKRTSTAFIITALLLVAGLSASAQNFQGLNTLQNIAQEGQNAGKYVVNIAFVFCGVVGAIMLIPAAIKSFKGEQGTRDAITNIGLGLITVFVILAIIKVVMSFS